MGLHAHQARNGNRNTSETPLFLQQFAHECVEAGVDVVVITGPHTLRGIEVHQRRPIFYSLGNFFFHEDAIRRIPESINQTVESTVPDVRGEVASPETDSTVTHDTDNWISVVPQCEFSADGTLANVTLYPCTLQPRAPTPQRGTPALATGEKAHEILQTLAERSEAFGTTIHINGDTGTIDLP
ncbi:CapA family protein [Halostagnicola kamekurae]|uniref:CapA family protein n=1 Tax=Halostagnicola kamekurae TaxID=619731 RepID=UPI000B844E43